MDPILLSRLRDAYVATFAAKKEGAAAALEASRANPAALGDLIRIVHSLAGSGASFGLPAVSRYCQVMEARLTRLIADPALLDRQELTLWQALLCQVLDLTAADPTWNGELAVPVPAPSAVAVPATAAVRERILIVDSNPDTRGLLGALLQQRGSSVRTAAGAEEALAAIDREPPDLVILDTEIGAAASELDGVVRRLEGNGELAVCRLASAMPVDGGDESQWIVRPFDPAAAVGRAAALLERRRLLAEHSLQDPVTGVLNRRAFLEHLSNEISRRDRSRRPLTVGVARLTVDLPAASAVGQGVNHRVLKAVAGVLLKSVRRYDVVGRWTTDRFALGLAGLEPDGAQTAGQRVLAALAALSLPVRGGQVATVTASLGLLCSRPADGRDAASLVDVAAAACDKAGGGRGLEVLEQ